VGLHVVGLHVVGLFLLASCADEQVIVSPVVDGFPVDTITVNVDVVLPASIQKQWEDATDWALSNIAIAQQKLNRQVKLNLRYHDEDTEDLDELGRRLTHPAKGDDTCHAIIGPYHDDHAMSLLAHARTDRLPVVMPTCSSAELQRINARNTYAWFITESDITQCEIMVSAAKAMKATDVALVYSDDAYGHSFRDWFAFYAAEQGIHIAGGLEPYKKGQDLSAFMDEVLSECKGNSLYMNIALSDAMDYRDVCEQCLAAYRTDKIVVIQTLCASTSYDQQLLATDIYKYLVFGVSPVGSMNYGFNQTYEGRFFKKPIGGEAQMYDALTLIALGAAHRAANPNECLLYGQPVVYSEPPYEPGLTDHMRSVICSWEGVSTQWDAAGLSTAFSELAAGRSVDISGATGMLFVDDETQTKVLNTTYMLWTLKGETTDVYSLNNVQPIIYLSTAGTSSEASTKEIWKMDKTFIQEFQDDYVPKKPLPELTDRWAVVISPSTTWINYRHQADAFAMYQLLRRHGYDDAHIVLIVEDNLAFDTNNVYPGKIFVEDPKEAGNSESAGNDVRKDAVVDYRFTDLRPEDLANIMLGRQSERLPHVIHPDANSDVFVFWSGHGGSKDGPLWGNEDATEYFGSQRLMDIVEEMSGKGVDGETNSSLFTLHSSLKKYRRMMFAIETCYSGKWGEALEGTPDVLVLTAASPYETSKADVHNNELGVYLSNAFARTFRFYIDLMPSISIYDLYKELFRSTNGSHVTIYNQQQYGSVYEETMEEFFGGQSPK
jgi:glycosylphosphatidylinositol transamidase (GPIT) subunit GPI8/ABC-type branched-subunit amino acid transport system substrate-binding protein